MEGRGSGSSNIPTGTPDPDPFIIVSCSEIGTVDCVKYPELESLQKRHEEKGLKIQELRRRAQAAELQLQEKRRAEEGAAAAAARDEKKEALRGLEDKLNKLREEYNDLPVDRSGEEKGKRLNSPGPSV